MKNSTIIVTFLLILLGVTFLTPISRSYTVDSETFPLVESASVSRIVSANVGDLIIGEYTVSNVPNWLDPSTGDQKTVQYAFKIQKIFPGTDKNPGGPQYFEAVQTIHSSFNVLCKWNGTYILRFNIGSGAPDTGIGNMTATLNYHVQKGTPATIQAATNALHPPPKPAGTPFWVLPAALITAAYIIAVVEIYSVRRSERKLPYSEKT